MNSIEKNLTEQFRKLEHLKFPGCQIQAYYKGKKRVDFGWGETYPYYDLASLTKIIFTTLWYMDQVQKRRMSIDSKVSFYLPWYPHSRNKVKDLLSHSAGNNWWEPFYKKISPHLEPEQKYQQLEKLCQQAPIKSQSKAVYSDIDFFLLGSVMKELSQKPLLNNWQNLFDEFYPKTSLHFNPIGKKSLSQKLYAPTEKCPWRKKILQGEVHDENAWSIGGVAPHAGLFGSIDDLSAYGKLLRDALLGRNKKLDEKVFKKFIKRSVPKEKGDWGLGFMLPSEKSSSAGEMFSRNSFGHTGFTGTSFWFDPKRDLYVCILSNRVHPTRENRDFVSLRPKIHDWIVAGVEERK